MDAVSWILISFHNSP